MALAHLAAEIGPVPLVGYAASLAVFATFCMRTMMPLRILALVSNGLFIAYGWLDNITPVLILHVVLLPVNAWRLILVLRLIGAARSDERGFDFGVLRPHMTKQRVAAGQPLFQKNDPADAMYVIASGELIVQPGGILLGPGEIVGEMGVLSRNRSRTATVLARADSALWRLPAAKMRELWFQHPAFALHLIEVLTDRLIDDVAAQTAAGGTAPRRRRVSPEPSGPA